MKKTWPKTLGDRDRATQYDSYVKPLSAEEKIVLTQQAHAKTQKELNKAVMNIEHAMTSYFKAHYGAKEVISKLDAVRFEIKDLQEDIMKLTMNALPYKELDGEREKELLYVTANKKISVKTLTYIGLIFINLLLYIAAFAFDINWLYTVGIIVSFGILLSLYTPWSKKIEESLATSNKVKPK